MTELDTLLEHFAYSLNSKTKRLRVHLELIDDDDKIIIYQKELNVVHITQLPLDLIFEISHYLTIRDLLNLRIRYDNIWKMRFNHDFIPIDYRNYKIFGESQNLRFYKFQYLRWFKFHFGKEILLGNIKERFINYQLSEIEKISVNHQTADILLYYARRQSLSPILYQLLCYTIQFHLFDDFCFLYHTYQPTNILKLFIIACHYRSIEIIQFFVKTLKPNHFDQLTCKDCEQIMTFLNDFEIIDLFANKYHLLIHSLDEQYMKNQLYFKIYQRIGSPNQISEVWNKSFNMSRYIDAPTMEFVIQLIRDLGYKKLSSFYIFNNLLRYGLWHKLKFDHHRAWVIRRHIREIERNYRNNKFRYYTAFEQLIKSLNEKNQSMLWHWAKKKNYTIILEILK